MHVSGPNGRARNDGDAAGRLQFVIPSDFVDGREVQTQIMDAIERQRFSENDVFAIKLALEEALINAIKHGNKFATDKRVRIDADVNDEGVEIIIHDQGAGFSREDVPDPTLEENLEKNSGRGILLIESYMTSAEWTDNGRRLRMYKKREPALTPEG